MKTILEHFLESEKPSLLSEYLLSKTKKVSTRPTSNSSVEEIAEWIKSYGVKQVNMGGSPAPHDIIFSFNRNKTNKSDYWIALRNKPKGEQSIVVRPLDSSYYYGENTNYKDVTITMEVALDKMEQMLNNKDMYI